MNVPSRKPPTPPWSQTEPQPPRSGHATLLITPSTTLETPAPPTQPVPNGRPASTRTCSSLHPSTWYPVDRQVAAAIPRRSIREDHRPGKAHGENVRDGLLQHSSVRPALILAVPTLTVRPFTFTLLAPIFVSVLFSAPAPAAHNGATCDYITGATYPLVYDTSMNTAMSV